MESKYKLTAICFSCIHHSHAKILLSSIQEYVPHYVEVYINFCDTQFTYTNYTKKIHTYNYKASNYGDAYNFIVQKAFEKHKYIIVCNDDVVFTPDTYKILNQDYEQIQNNNLDGDIGWVGCLTNHAIGWQNIRRNEIITQEELKYSMSYITNERESKITQIDFVVPICAAISKTNWIDYLPINYFSDNFQCWEMRLKGMKHYISTAYVHHAGSQTIDSAETEKQKALSILLADYPQYYSILQK